MNVNNILSQVQELLPPDSAFILVVTQAGQITEPTFICNTEPDDAIEAMRTIVGAYDFQNVIKRN